MNYKFIQNVQIDWTRIGDYSYIRNIPALQFEDALVFEKNMHWLVFDLYHLLWQIYLYQWEAKQLGMLNF